MTAAAGTRRGGLTVIDVCRSLGVVPRPRLMWAIGNAARDLYLERYGHLPEKSLRTKTYRGVGSHCFAIYPEHMRADLERIVWRLAYDAVRQQGLF